MPSAASATLSRRNINPESKDFSYNSGERNQL